MQAASGADTAGFAHATVPRPFVFPHDHGAHSEYATEWWYYAGNLDADDGRHFGFQLTFFRSALAPAAPPRASDWAATNIYMAHFAVTDVGGGGFHAFDRFSRGATVTAPGMGLGLYLVKTLVERQGGYVTVGERPGGGAAFHVLLPAVDRARVEARGGA